MDQYWSAARRLGTTVVIYSYREGSLGLAAVQVHLSQVLFKSALYDHV